MRRCYISVGSNLGDSVHTVRQSIKVLSHFPEVALLKTSRFYRTAPVGAHLVQPDFINVVIEIETNLPADELLAILHGIEKLHGRQRGTVDGPRTLDMDLLLAGDEQIDNAVLTVPHPQMCQRAFVLVPLAELAPALAVPGQEMTVAELAAQTEVKSQVVEVLDKVV